MDQCIKVDSISTLVFRSSSTNIRAVVLAHHDLLVLFHLTLFLRRDRIKTTAAGIPFYRNNCKTVAIALPDLIITGKQPIVYMLSCFGNHLLKCLSSFSVAAMIFAILLSWYSKHPLNSNGFFSLFQQYCFLGHLFIGIFNVFFAKLYFQLLHSISLLIPSNSRLFFTLSLCFSYFFTNAWASLIASFFCSINSVMPLISSSMRSRRE